jgi:hypothetical protein
MSVIKFTTVKMGSGKNDKIMIKSKVEENTFLQISRKDYFKSLLATTNCYEKAKMACNYG